MRHVDFNSKCVDLLALLQLPISMAPLETATTDSLQHAAFHRKLVHLEDLGNS